MSRAWRTALRIAGVVLAGALCVLGVRAVDARSQPPLERWHRAALPSEHRADDPARATRWGAYLHREQAVFAELAASVERDEGARFDRFARDSESHPRRVARAIGAAHDWNRSFETAPGAPGGAGGALLLHGLTDGPYSHRHLARRLERADMHVVVPRLPGHGTHPGGLAHVRAEDWRDATDIAARHLGEAIRDDAPFVVVGYSMGGTLAVDYALRAIDDPALRAPDRLVLISPAVGVHAAGALAAWHRALSWIPAFDRFAWLELLPEYDPFKYNSFPKNGGRQMYRLASQLQARLAAVEADGGLDALAPTLCFQSVVDDTVSTRAVVDELFTRLGRSERAAAHALVLFDVNRSADIEAFIDDAQRASIAALVGETPPAYQFTVVGNAAPQRADVVARERGVAATSPAASETGLAWPAGVYSLSHVALAFPPGDPLYGADATSRLPIGRLAPRGERGVLRLSLANLMRLRHNPFHPIVEARIDAWLGLR